MTFAWPVAATLFMLAVAYVESKGSGTVKPPELNNCTVNNSISLGSEAFANAVLLCNGSYKNIICDNHWTTADAMVACRSLGKSVEGAIPDRFDQTATSYVNYEYVPHCDGTEGQLSDCEWVIRPNSNLPCDFYIGVICPDPSVSVVSSTIVQSSPTPTSSIAFSSPPPSPLLSQSQAPSETPTVVGPRENSSPRLSTVLVGLIGVAGFILILIVLSVLIMALLVIVYCQKRKRKTTLDAEAFKKNASNPLFDLVEPVYSEPRDSVKVPCKSATASSSPSSSSSSASSGTGGDVLYHTLDQPPSNPNAEAIYSEVFDARRATLPTQTNQPPPLPGNQARTLPALRREGSAVAIPFPMTPPELALEDRTSLERSGVQVSFHPPPLPPQNSSAQQELYSSLEVTKTYATLEPFVSSQHQATPPQPHGGATSPRVSFSDDTKNYSRLVHTRSTLPSTLASRNSSSSSESSTNSFEAEHTRLMQNAELHAYHTLELEGSKVGVPRDPPEQPRPPLDSKTTRYPQR